MDCDHLFPRKHWGGVTHAEQPLVVPQRSGQVPLLPQLPTVPTYPYHRNIPKLPHDRAIGRENDTNGNVLA